MKLEIWPFLTWPWPDHYKLLKIASHDPMDTLIELLGQCWPGNMCRMTYLWLGNYRDLLWPSYDLECTQYRVRILMVLLVCSWEYFGRNWVHSELANGRQSPTCEHVPNVDIFYCALTCDVIGDPEVSKIKFPSTTLAGLSNTVWILKIGSVVSEIGGG